MALVEPAISREEQQRGPTCGSRCKVKKMIKRWSSSNLASRTSSTTTLPANGADTPDSPIQIPRISTPIPEGQVAMSEKGGCEDEKHIGEGNTASEAERTTEEGTGASPLTEEKSPALEPESTPAQETKTQPLSPHPPLQTTENTESRSPDSTQPPTSPSPPTSNQQTNPSTTTPISSPPLQSTSSHPSLRTHKSKPSIHIPPISPSPDTRSTPSTAHKHTSSAQSDIEQDALALVLPKSTITTTITAAAPQESAGRRRSLVRKSSMKWWMVERWGRWGAHEKGGEGERGRARG